MCDLTKHLNNLPTYYEIIVIFRRKKEIDFSTDFFSSTYKIPLSIFSQKTSPLETIVKYLRENHDLGFTEIGRLLARDGKTIWKEYQNAHAKHKHKFKICENEFYFDINIFARREHSILEILCHKLKESGYSISQIAYIIKKHRNTVWSVCSRFKKKND